MENLQRLNREFENKSPEEVLTWAAHHFGMDQIALASSLGAEDQVLTDMLITLDPQAIVFTLDTGRLPSEAYECMRATTARYGFQYRVYSPNAVAVEKMVAEKGLDLFYENVANRQLCCYVRKIEPLKRALQGLKVWVCGLRRAQSVTRSDFEIVEWDKTNGLYKINPLVHWTEEQVWDYIKSRKVPYNKLHDQGYPSIGCAPCTRAVKAGEDIRAGRWWWEHPEHKECGLHFKDGKVMRKGK